MASTQIQGGEVSEGINAVRECNEITTVTQIDGCEFVQISYAYGYGSKIKTPTQVKRYQFRNFSEKFR